MTTLQVRKVIFNDPRLLEHCADHGKMQI